MGGVGLHSCTCTCTYLNKAFAFTLVFVFSALQLSSSFYVYQVSKKLAHAEHILMFMGYKSISSGSQDIQELNYEGEVDSNKVLETAADLVILHSELELVKELVERVLGEPRTAAVVSLQEILKARSQTKSYNETWTYLMKVAYTPPQQQAVVHPQQRLDVQAGSNVALQAPQGYQRQASAGRQYPNQMVMSTSTEVIRRGSAPVLSTNERPPLPQSLSTRTPPLQRGIERAPLLQRGMTEEALSAGTAHVPPTQPLQLPQHQQHPRREPPSARGSSEPSSSFDMRDVHHDAHEKIHARSRHDQVNKLQTLTADQIADPSAQQHHHPRDNSPALVQSHLPPSSAAEPTHVPSDILYQNIGSLLQSSPAAGDGEHHMQPRPYETIHEGTVTTGADGHVEPRTGQSSSELLSDSHLEYQSAENLKHHAQLDNSVQVRQVEDLFKQFPNLVPGHESENAGTGSEDSAKIYQNIPGPARNPGLAAADSRLPFKLPEPVVDSESGLENLAHPPDIPRGSIVSGLKNVRSVDYDNTRGPEDFLSGLQSPATPQTPCLVQNQQEEAAWAIPQEANPQPHSYPSSSGSNRDKHSPGSSLGDNVALQQQKRGSCSGSDSEDLYNSGPSGEFDRAQRRGAPSREQIPTVQETDEPRDGVVKDSVTTTTFRKPIAKKRTMTPKQQSFDVLDTSRKNKPLITPRRYHSGSNLLDDLSGSEDADAHGRVSSAPSSPAHSSSKSAGFASNVRQPDFHFFSASENLQLPSPASSRQQAKPTPKSRGQSPLSSAGDKDESNLDRKQRPGAGGYQRPAGRPEQYFSSRKLEKALPTTDVSQATAKLDKDSADNPRAIVNQQEHPKQEPPQKLSAGGLMKSHTSAVKPEEEIRDQLLRKVQTYDMTMKWICSYCTNVVYEPGAFRCDVCGHLKSTAV